MQEKTESWYSWEWPRLWPRWPGLKSSPQWSQCQAGLLFALPALSECHHLNLSEQCWWKLSNYDEYFPPSVNFLNLKSTQAILPSGAGIFFSKTISVFSWLSSFISWYLFPNKSSLFQAFPLLLSNQGYCWATCESSLTLAHNLIPHCQNDSWIVQLLPLCQWNCSVLWSLVASWSVSL